MVCGGVAGTGARSGRQRVLLGLWCHSLAVGDRGQQRVGAQDPRAAVLLGCAIDRSVGALHPPIDESIFACLPAGADWRGLVWRRMPGRRKTKWTTSNSARDRSSGGRCSCSSWMGTPAAAGGLPVYGKMLLVHQPLPEEGSCLLTICL